jgi:hypothetical protein
MGREARMRMEAKEAKSKTLTRWAQENPEKFEHKWTKRVNSWLGEIWISKVFITNEEFMELLEKYPVGKEVLESNSISHDNGVCIYLSSLKKIKKELGSEVVNEILSHTKGGILSGKPIFSIVDHARKTLVDCGEKAMELQIRETTDLLNNECCRALSPHIGMEIYRINQRWKPKE